MRRVIFFLFIGFLFLTSASMAATPAEIATARNKGLAWLISHQNGDGSWNSAPGAEVQSSAAVLNALVNSGITGSGFSYNGAIAWLGNAGAPSVDSLSQKIIALNSTGRDVKADLDLLLSWKNKAQGYGATWGTYNQYETSFPDTPLALSAIRLANYTYSNQNSDLGNGVCYILLSQHSDGSWSYLIPATITQENLYSGAVLPTIYTVMELEALKTSWSPISCYGVNYNLQTTIDNGISWLMTKKNLDNGFGNNGESSILETALAYSALKTLRPTDPATDLAMDYLLSKQSADGSWQNDALKTGSVLGVFPATVLADVDGDGVPDDVEILLGTNPNVADSRWLVNGNGQSSVGATAPLLFPVAHKNQYYTYNAPIEGGSAPFTWSIVSGDLPNGLIINTATGAISGTPVETGTFNFVYGISDSSVPNVLAQISAVDSPDTVPPTGSIMINNSASSTASVAVILGLAATDNSGMVTRMRFSNDGTAWTGWEPYATGRTWTLTAGDGGKTVYVKYSDIKGNESLNYNDTIILDTVPPATASTPNGGGFDSPQTITLSCADATSGCSSSFYCLGVNCNNFDGYTNPITISDSTDLRFYSTDLAGNAETVKSATFIIEVCPNLPVKVEGINPGNFNSLQAAYDSAASGDIIKVHAKNFTENLNLNRVISVTFTGGYDCDFTQITGSTVLFGNTNITSGTNKLENLQIK